MTACTYTIPETERAQKRLEVTQHPAWCGHIDEQESVALLRDVACMTYLLRQDSRGEYDFWISHKDMDGLIRHRHFAIHLFADGWFFENYGAPTCEFLHDFIEGALVCKVFE